MTLKEFQKTLIENPDTPVPDLQSLKVWKCETMELLPLHKFIELEMCFEENDYFNFCNIFVKKRWWETIHVHNLYKIFEEYGRQKAELKEKYKFVFDPPFYGEPVPETVGSELRKEFVQDFGVFVVLMDLVCKGDFTRFQEVEKWKAQDFLFWANYLTGQKIIENVK